MLFFAVCQLRLTKYNIAYLNNTLQQSTLSAIMQLFNTAAASLEEMCSLPGADAVFINQELAAKFYVMSSLGF